MTSEEIPVFDSRKDLGIPVFDSHKNLGIVISNDMSWDKHYGLLISKAYGKQSRIRRTFSLYIPMKTKKLLYYFYKISVCLNQSYRDRVQRTAAKYILSDFTSNYKSRLVTLELLPLMMFLELQEQTCHPRVASIDDVLKTTRADLSPSSCFH